MKKSRELGQQKNNIIIFETKEGEEVTIEMGNFKEEFFNQGIRVIGVLSGEKLDVTTAQKIEELQVPDYKITRLVKSINQHNEYRVFYIYTK